jgi:hypothetical protein
MGFLVKLKQSSLSPKKKQQKGVLGGGTAVPHIGTGRAKLLTWGRLIFVSESSYFSSESAPYSFLLLQDSIHRIFIPEI